MRGGAGEGHAQKSSHSKPAKAIKTCKTVNSFMRPISWKTYAAAFLISAFLFGFGILAGAYLQQNANTQFDSEISRLQSQTSQLEVLLLLSPNNTRTLCPFYQSSLAAFDKETTAFGSKLDALEQARGRNDPYVLNLKQEYTLKQVRDFLLIEKTDALCNTQTHTLLYFYTNQNCAECQRQGPVGPQLKADHPELMIYALDTGLQTPAVNALQTIYGVTSYPTLVLDGNRMEGFQTKEKVEKKLTQN